MGGCGEGGLGGLALAAQESGQFTGRTAEPDSGSAASEIEGARLEYQAGDGHHAAFFNLIDGNDSDCPIRRQMLPSVQETETAPWEMGDPCGEDSHSPVPSWCTDIPTACFLVTDRCAAYCRYCTRSRLVSNALGYDFRRTSRRIEYIRRTPAVRMCYSPAVMPCCSAIPSCATCSPSCAPFRM